MEVNNVARIRELLSFEGPSCTYQIQIIKRRKENPDMKTGARIILEKLISSIEHYDNSISDLIEIAKATRARVYLNLNPVCSKQASREMLRKLIDKIDEDKINLQATLTSACSVQSSRFKTETRSKLWMIDIDDKEMYNNSSSQISELLTRIRPVGDKIVSILNTPNGVHVICKPFDVNQFSKLNPFGNDFEFKKTALTILFVPSL